MSTIKIGPCKCGGYGQVYDEESERVLGKCHDEVGSRHADEGTLKWIAHLESQLKASEDARVKAEEVYRQLQCEKIEWCKERDKLQAERDGMVVLAQVVRVSDYPSGREISIRWLDENVSPSEKLYRKLEVK